MLVTAVVLGLVGIGIIIAVERERIGPAWGQIGLLVLAIAVPFGVLAWVNYRAAHAETIIVQEAVVKVREVQRKFGGGIFVLTTDSGTEVTFTAPRKISVGDKVTLERLSYKGKVINTTLK